MRARNGRRRSWAAGSELARCPKSLRRARILCVCSMSCVRIGVDRGDGGGVICFFSHFMRRYSSCFASRRVSLRVPLICPHDCPRPHHVRAISGAACAACRGPTGVHTNNPGAIYRQMPALPLRPAASQEGAPARENNKKYTRVAQRRPPCRGRPPVAAVVAPRGGGATAVASRPAVEQARP